MRVAVLVIAGSGRGVGKTAVGCALIAAMPELRWVAVKVTPHFHGVGLGIWEELDSRSDKDTGRYLAAGARRAFLVTMEWDSGTGLVARVREAAAECDALIVESGRIAAEIAAREGERSVSLLLVAGDESGWKASVMDGAARVDAVVVSSAETAREFAAFQMKPVFVVARDEWVTPALVRFVRERLMVWTTSSNEPG